MKIISVRQNPKYKEKAIKYLQESSSEISPIIYEDCILNTIQATWFLRQWYLMELDEKIIRCGMLITNDFISRMDLYPCVCAIYIDEKHRGDSYDSLLLEKAKEDQKVAGFKHLNLCTDHVAYYEKNMGSPI